MLSCWSCAFFGWSLLLSYAGVMGCGAAEATGLGFVCFVVINPRVLSANKVDLGSFFFFFFFFFFFINYPILPPHHPQLTQYSVTRNAQRVGSPCHRLPLVYHWKSEESSGALDSPWWGGLSFRLQVVIIFYNFAKGIPYLEGIRNVVYQLKGCEIH